MDNSSDRWRRPLIEAVVIVLSILAALAINTWWSNVQQHRRARSEVASLRAEFDAADKELARASAELQSALNATHRLTELAGPQPQPINPDTFALLLTRALTINAVQLPNGALANVLSSGDLPILDDLELQKALASWPSVATLMSVKFTILVTDRDESVLPMVNGQIAVSPMLANAFPSQWSDAHTFAFNAAPLLADREFENVMAERWMGIWIAAYTVTDAQTLSKSISNKLAAWH